LGLVENKHSLHLDLSLQAEQTFFGSRKLGMYSKTRSMACVMGAFNAQAILRSVRDDSKLNSGVYAIGRSPPFKTQRTICRPANGPLIVENGLDDFRLYRHKSV
jgi:hypothetical protein